MWMFVDSHGVISIDFTLKPVYVKPIFKIRIARKGKVTVRNINGEMKGYISCVCIAYGRVQSCNMDDEMNVVWSSGDRLGAGTGSAEESGVWY